MNYFLHILIVAGIFSILTASLDLMAGRTGMLSLAHGSFFGIGAYASALFTTHWEADFILAAIAGMAVAAVLSLAVSLTSARLRGDFFALATLGFQMVVFSIFNNCLSLTRGPLGIRDIPKPQIFSWVVESESAFLMLTFLVVGFAYLGTYRLTRSPFGRVLSAIREDETFAKALGKNTLNSRVVVIAVSAIMASTAGTLYAHYFTYIDPSSFDLMVSVLVVSMVIIGGPGTLLGPLIGAVLLVSLPEALRFIGLPSSILGNARQIIYGIALVACILWRPNGLVGKYAIGRNA